MRHPDIRLARLISKPEFPPEVYLLCAEHVRDPEQARIARRNTKDGRVALLAYSALDRLYVRCGPDQPWPVTTTTALDEVQRVQPVHVLLLDVVVPAEERQEVVMATATAGATAIDAYAADLETAPSRRGLKVGGALAVAAVGNLTEDAWDAIF